MTVNDLIRRAMRSLGVLHTKEDPTADEAADALATLNDMLNAWRLTGIDLEHLTMNLTDTLPYADEDASAIRYNLAVELSAEYGIDPPMVVVALARNTYIAIKAKYTNVATLAVDSALSPIWSTNLEPGFYGGSI
jgi:hypothetical protein